MPPVTPSHVAPPNARPKEPYAHTVPDDSLHGHIFRVPPCLYHYRQLGVLCVFSVMGTRNLTLGTALNNLLLSKEVYLQAHETLSSSYLASRRS